MGYILPVNQYAYQKYQERIIKNKQSPYDIQALYKVTQLNFRNEFKHKNSNFELFKIKHSIQDNYAWVVALTGKGHLFNEFI